MSPKHTPNKIKSGNTHKDFLKVLGGLPEKKSVEQIAKVNSPKGRDAAPGSIRKR